MSVEVECFDCGRGIEIDDEMVERAGRALCDYENQTEAANAKVQGHRFVALRYEEFSGDFNATARSILTAALQREQ